MKPLGPERVVKQAGQLEQQYADPGAGENAAPGERAAVPACGAEANRDRDGRWGQHCLIGEIRHERCNGHEATLFVRFVTASM